MHFGNGELYIHPYKLKKEKKQHFELETKTDKELYSKASKVNCYIEDMGRLLGLLNEDQNVSNLSKVESDDLFDKVYTVVVNSLYPDGDYCSRLYDLTYTALYNRMCKKQN